MDKIRELREKRAKALADARGIRETADKEKRAITTDETTKANAFMDEWDRLGGEIRDLERIEAAERDMASTTPAKPGRHDIGGDDERDDDTDEMDPGLGILTAEEKRFAAMASAIRAVSAPAPSRTFRFSGPFATKDYRKVFNRYLLTGDKNAAMAEMKPEAVRALQADLDTVGGYLVAPQQFVAQLIKFVDDAVFIRRAATTNTVATAQSLGVPSLDADPADSDWTAELGTGNEDSTMAFGKRELTPHPLAKRIKLSNKLLRMSMVGAEALVRARLGYKFAITQEKAFLLGTGNNQPLGVFTVSNSGIPTTRDVVCGTTTAITSDGIKDMKFTLKGNYWGSAAWMFHRDGVRQIAKLKDAVSRYLWEDAIRNGESDRLLGFPVYMSEYAPNTFTTGLYVGILADWSQYWIADALDLTIQRLAELYAETNQVGFIARMETDGMPVLAEGFVRGKLA